MTGARRVRGPARAALVGLVFAHAPLLSSCGTNERSERVQQTAPSARAQAPAADTANPMPASEPTPAGPAMGQPVASTPAVVDVVRTANTIAIRSARVARTRSANDAVRAYAVQIVDDQTTANSKLSQLAQRLRLQPRRDAASQTLTAEADRARASIETKRGTGFDRAYIENEIEFHHRMLDLIDRRLIPAVADSEMKALLVVQRSTLEAQLGHAQHLQASLAP